MPIDPSGPMLEVAAEPGARVDSRPERGETRDDQDDDDKDCRDEVHGRDAS